MRQKINILWFLAPCLLLLLNACEIDNYDGPNAILYGSIKDATTGELVGTDLQNGSAIRAYELGWPTRTAQTWLIKNTGEYRNDFVFAANYDLEFINGNFFPFEVLNFNIKTGENQRDFEVTPYLRIRDVSITHNAAEKKIVATFKIQGGKPEVKLSAIRLYAFSDMHVGEQVKYATTGSNFSMSFSPAKVIDDSETYTLSIDLEANANLIKYNMNYYFRVGALANVSGVGTIRHNYSSLVEIPL